MRRLAIPENSVRNLARELERVRGNIKVEWVILDRQLAHELLAKNRLNRKLRDRAIERIIDALSHWEVNGDTIVVSESDRLLNGQHRCEAVLKTGFAVITLLVTGVADAAFTTYDVQARRSAADVLQTLGKTNCNVLAGALSWVERYFSKSMERTIGVPTWSVEQLLEEHSDLIEAVKLTSKNRQGPPSLLVAMHYLFRRLDASAADRFFEDLKTGAGLPATDPCYWLRERMVKQRVDKAKLPHYEIAALIIKAWNQRQRGVICRQLKWDSKREEYPIIDGLPPLSQE